MEIIKKEEFVKDGITFIRETYDNGTIVEYGKPSDEPMPEPEPEPMPEPVTLEQIQANQLDMMDAIADLYLMQDDGGATV